MIWPRFVLLLTLFTIGFAGNYEKPNYPNRPMSKEENKILLNTCGRPPVGKSQHKAWNPDFINRTDAPWVESVLAATQVWLPNMKGEHLHKFATWACSGTLISSRHVITAAHCIKPNVLRTVFVIDDHCSYNSSECLAKPMYLRQASRVFSSVRYAEQHVKDSVTGGDVAVFELTEDIPFSENVWPACLGDTDIQVGQILDLYGFGVNGFNNDSYALQHVPIEAASCKKATFSDHFCSYVPYQKPCAGDSGAGLIETDRHERKFVVATHAGGLPCELAEKLMVNGPNSVTLEKVHTLLKPHLYWICEATGICANEQIVKDVEQWKNLPNRHRERYDILEPLEEEEIYV